MKNSLYCVYDRISEEAGPVFESRNDAVAMRNFNKMLQKDGIDVSEFWLFCVGEFDHDLVRIEAIDKRRVLANLSMEDEEDAASI